MKPSDSKKLLATITEMLEADNNPLKQVIVSSDGTTFQQIDEGKTIDGRFKDDIRIDQPTHLRGDGQQHGHVFARNGRDEVVIVNYDGTGSHGTKGRLHHKDADALRARGFKIRDDNIVEWTVLKDQPEMLYG